MTAFRGIATKAAYQLTTQLRTQRLHAIFGVIEAGSGAVIGLVLAIVAGVALLTILFGKMIQWLLEGFFAKTFTEREAAIASISAMLGGSIGYLILDWSANPLMLAEKIGSILGLLGLWWVLFRRRQAIG